jgi:hypothetical protein
MSLPKKLRRFFAEVRREAKRNPAFAARLESALDALAPDDLLDDEDEAETETTIAEAADEDDAALDVNPVAIARREGADGLRQVISGLPETALRGLIAEHNLDPADQSPGLRKDALVDLIVMQAHRRIERDRKLFDY